MEDKNNNIDIFKEVKSPFKKSEEELWNSIEAEISKSEEPKVYRLKFYAYAVAASVTIFLALALIANYYTESFTANKAEQFALNLPDGSLVSLNSDSRISYKPLMWWLSREVKFEGEAFFEVEKGSDFKVYSKNGTTQVLGTSFNINSRGKSYYVYCNTGRVKVSSELNNTSVEITPGEIAKSNSRSINVEESTPKEALDWKEDKFSFTSEPLPMVAEELEIRYDITINIDLPDAGNYEYTAYFDEYKNAEETLNLICKSLNLNYKRTSEKVYSIY